MGDNLRNNLILSQLDRINQVLERDVENSCDKFEIESDEERDTFSDFPTYNRSRSSIKKVLNAEDKHDSTWNTYFTTNERIKIKEQNLKFNLYYTLPTDTESMSIPVFIFHHGAGSSALSFANLSKTLTSRMNGQCGCFAFDARGHGDTVPIDNKIENKFDRENFVNDFIKIIEYIYAVKLADVSKRKISIILVGHSLGGSICTFAFDALSPQIRKGILGVTMLDIIEEAAIEALDKVQHFLSVTPNVFESYDDAVNWHIKNGMSKVEESAKIAIPALFMKRDDGKVVRITNLRIFSPYWNTWFKELSYNFVHLSTCKLLILAGNDNLDKELIIGQMQGKYQLVVFQDSGHFIQEDEPLKTALTLIDFWKRNDNKNVVIKTNWGNKK